MALSVGSLLADRYEITAPIATGGMGEVWRARDRVLDRTVAAKVLRSEYMSDPSFLARFRNEARHTAALTHPNIASVYDYGETLDDTGTQQLAFLVMEYVEGHPLVTILHDEGRLPADWTLHVLGQSAEGLSAAHRAGVVHRDIKPGNLIVRPDGVVKLTDFGIAQARDTAPLTRTGMVVGTAQYLSPEQAQGMEVTAASDVYSLGVVGYECLSGERPFDGASQVAIALAHINRPPPPLPADVPPAVRLLVERALAKDPADRFPDGAAFAEAIRRVASGGALAVFAGPATAGPATAPTQVVGGGGMAEARTQVLATTGATAVAGAAALGPGTGPGRPMPPLQAPPKDDDEWGPEDEPDPRRRRSRRWALVAAVLLLLLLFGGGAYYLLFSGNRGPDDPAANAPTATTSAGATGIPIDSGRYIGRPVDEVEADLEALGLVVAPTPAPDDLLEQVGRDFAADAVVALAPTDTTVPPQSTVTVYYAAEAYAPEDEEEEVEPEPTTAAPTTTARQTSAAPSTTTAPPPAASTSSSAATTTTLEGTTAPPPEPSPPPPPSPPADAGDGEEPAAAPEEGG
ncbi:MAG: protein kinase [Actinomycetota bacterium]|nr:protein kinase [Actinomycetota bacterium]